MDTFAIVTIAIALVQFVKQIGAHVSIPIPARVLSGSAPNQSPSCNRSDFTGLTDRIPPDPYNPHEWTLDLQIQGPCRACPTHDLF
jgi:hypothetical protein